MRILLVEDDTMVAAGIHEGLATPTSANDKGEK